jgi:hypothetical protein
MFPWLIMFYIKGSLYAYKLEALDYLGAIDRCTIMEMLLGTNSMDKRLLQRHRQVCRSKS